MKMLHALDNDHKEAGSGGYVARGEGSEDPLASEKQLRLA